MRQLKQTENIQHGDEGCLRHAIREKDCGSRDQNPADSSRRREEADDDSVFRRKPPPHVGGYRLLAVFGTGSGKFFILLRVTRGCGRDRTFSALGLHIPSCPPTDALSSLVSAAIVST